MPRIRIQAAAAALAALCASACDAPDTLLAPGERSDAVTVGVARIELSVDSATVLLGGGVRLVATTYNASGQVVAGSVRWRSSDPTVYDVNGSGLVKGVGVGRKRLVVTSEGKTDTAWIRVIPRTARVVIALDSMLIPTGRSAQIQATALDSLGLPIAGASVLWRSADSLVVRVGPTGIAEGRSVGRKRVIAESNGREDTIWVRVAPPAGRVIMSPDSAVVDAGGTQQMSLMLLDSLGAPLPLSGRTVAWRSSDTTVVRVSPTGVVTGWSPGRKRVIVTIEGKADTAWVRVNMPSTARLYGATIMNASLNTATGAQTVTFAATVSAPQGVSSVTFMFNGPSYSCTAVPLSGAPTTFNATCSYTFPRWATGSYPNISALVNNGNDGSFPVPGSITVVNSAPVYIRNVTVSDTIVSTATGEATVDVTMDAISAGGIQSANLSLNTPSRMCIVNPATPAPDSLRATCRFTFPRWENRGWPVQLSAQGYSGIAYHSAGNLTITSAAPVSLEITGVSNRNVNTAAGPQTVTISATASSIAGIETIYVYAGGTGDTQCRINPSTDAPDTLTGSCTVTYHQGASGTSPVNATAVARNGAMVQASSGQIVVTN